MTIHITAVGVATIIIFLNAIASLLNVVLHLIEENGTKALAWLLLSVGYLVLGFALLR